MNNIPVEVFLSTLVTEYDSALDVREGSAIYEMLVKPAAILFQHFRDDLDTFKRDLSLANYGVMSPTMLNALGANYFVYRRGGTRATGVQRIYFTTPSDFTITTAATFTTVAGLRYRPIASKTVSRETMAASYDYQTGLYYMDITAAAEYEGTSHIAEIGAVTTVQGIPQSSRTINITAYGSASDDESSADFYDRIVNSITNRDLVSRSAMMTVIPQVVPDVRSLSVIGYGDPEMARDVITVAANMQEVYPSIPCVFLTAWLNDDGTYSTTDETPYGEVGVLRIDDALGIDFTQLDVPGVGIVKLDIGWKISFDDADNRSHGLYTITAVTKTELVLNAPPESQGAFNFRIHGFTRNDSFHIGGKADVYIDAPIVTSNITISYLDVLNINLEQNRNVGPNNSPLFTNGSIVFPICQILSISVVSSTIGTPVVSTLADDRWSLVLKRNSGLDADYLIFQPHPEETYIGKSFQIMYRSMPDVTDVTAYLNSDHMDVTTDIKCYPAEQVLINILIEGDPKAEDIIRDLIEAKHIGENVSASEIHAALALQGITEVTYPIDVIAVRADAGGHYTLTSSESVITIARTEIAVPGDIMVTQCNQ